MFLELLAMLLNILYLTILWSLINKKLNSVILPSFLDNDDDVPYKLTHLSKAEIQKKETKGFIE